MTYKTLGFLVIICSIVGAWQVRGSISKEKEKWVEPNAWAKEVEVNAFQKSSLENGFCTCNGEGNIADVSSDNKVSLLVLKKFVRRLFRRENLQYDTQYSLFQRNVLFTILPAQLELIEETDDPRDLDNVLTEIFKSIRTQNEYNSSNGSWSRIFALIWDILKDCFLLLRFSEVRFIAIVLLVIIAGWFVHRKHNISIFFIIFGGFLIFGYFHTYLECNRELEMQQMIEIIEHNERQAQPYEPSWYSPITNWFGSKKEDIKQQRREKIKRESRLNLSFCRPDHVLMMYVNDIFLKQLEFLIDKCALTISKVKDNFSFPYNYIAAIFLLIMIGYMIKLTFEHVLSPRVWTGFFQRSNMHSVTQIQQSNEDRISGENLKILLSALNAPNILVNNANLPTISCAQEILEPLDALTEEQSVSSTSSSSSNSSNNNILNDNSFSKSFLKLSSTTSPISASTEAAQLEQETITATVDEDEAGDNVILISQVKSKVLIQDVPNDND